MKLKSAPLPHKGPFVPGVKLNPRQVIDRRGEKHPKSTPHRSMPKGPG